MIKQNIVFIENKAGSLQKVTELLAEAGIDIYGFACFDAPEFALFRMITNQADEAEKLLSENGYMNRVTEVIAVDLKDEVGGLNRFFIVFIFFIGIYDRLQLTLLFHQLLKTFLVVRYSRLTKLIQNFLKAHKQIL